MLTQPRAGAGGRPDIWPRTKNCRTTSRHQRTDCTLYNKPRFQSQHLRMNLSRRALKTVYKKLRVRPTTTEEAMMLLTRAELVNERFTPS
jgi:hypothetical protein